MSTRNITGLRKPPIFGKAASANLADPSSLPWLVGRTATTAQIEKHGTGAKKRLPPFGKSVTAILADSGRLSWFVGCNATRASVWIATGPDAWQWRDSHPRHLCIVFPYSAHPGEFSWAFLMGHHPILVLPPLADDPEGRAQLAAAILADGVESVLAMGADSWPLFSRGVGR